MTRPMAYRVGALRSAGLEARWTRTAAGAPIIAARDPHAPTGLERDTWWLVDRELWGDMQASGARQALGEHTELAVFSGG